MVNMANFFNLVGQGIMDPYSQKQPLKQLSLYSMPAIDIQPGKTFANPNFVNKSNPRVHHSQYNIPTFSPKESRIDIYRFDIPDVANSSHSILNTVKEKNFKILEGDDNSPKLDDLQMTSGRKGTKRKNKQVESNCVRKDEQLLLHTDMEVDTDNQRESSLAGMQSPECPELGQDELSADEDDYVTVEDDQFQFVDLSPSNGGTPRIRERQLSIAESEDSFIVFRSGTDDELMFSDSDDDTDSEIEQDFDSVDSSSSVIPYKKVRFADDSELCEVHPMVQWSFAYQQARKGPWEEYARDRDRFSKRIREAELIMAPVLQQKHREKIYQQRFEDDGYSSQDALSLEM